MTVEIIILAVAIHALFWEHLPHWGTWFTRIIERLPAPLQGLYEYWRCPYCAGFWIALALHAATGLWTFPVFADLPAFWGGAALPLGWFLDALATAILIRAGVVALHAISLPAMQAHTMRDAFLAARKKTAPQQVVAAEEGA